MAISDTCSESDAGRVELRNGWNKNRHGAGWRASPLFMIEDTQELKGRSVLIDVSSSPVCQPMPGKLPRRYALIGLWTLEDQSTVRKDHAPQNIAIVRHAVLNMVNTAK